MMPLDKNESYWLLDDELAAAVRPPSIAELSTYPDYDELKKALAQYAGVAQEQILPTPGSASAIECVARAYTGGEEALVPVPTFYGYETILGYTGTRMTPIVYEERDGRFVFPLGKTVAALKNGTAKALFLCQPNNPLGCPLSEEDVSALVEAVRGSSAMLISDEAYFEFSSGASFLPHLSELPNLIVIRSLSKAFALSGARVGYAIAAQNVIEKLQSFMIPWAIAGQSVVAALALLTRADKVGSRRASVISVRKQFMQELSALPSVTAYPSETNFILVRVPDAVRVRDALLARDIRVALGESMSEFQEAKKLLIGTLRIAIPAPESEALVLGVLRDAVIQYGDERT